MYFQPQTCYETSGSEISVTLVKWTNSHNTSNATGRALAGLLVGDDDKLYFIPGTQVGLILHFSLMEEELLALLSLVVQESILACRV